MIGGGYEYDGCTELTPINETEVLQTIDKLKNEQATNIVISGVFSPVNPDHEAQVLNLIPLSQHY